MEPREAIPAYSGADEFDVRASLRRVVQACLAYKLVIVLCCVVTLTIAAAYKMIWPPIYQAGATLVADGKEDALRDDFYSLWGVFRKVDPKSEARLMTVRPVLERVIRELDLKYDEVYHPPLSYAGYLWSESWVGKRYRAIKESIFPPKESPYAPTAEEAELARTLDDFRYGVGLEPVADTNVGNLMVRGPSPRVAEIANKVVEVALAERRGRLRKEAQDAHDALKSEVDAAWAELQALEGRQEQYYTEQGLLLQFEKDKVEISRMLELEREVLDRQAERDSIATSLRLVKEQLAREEKEIVASRITSSNPLRESMKNERFILEQRRQELLCQYLPASREVADVEERIAALDRMIETETTEVESSKTVVLSDTYEQLRQQSQSLDNAMQSVEALLAPKEAALAEMKSRIARIPEKMKVAYDFGRSQSILQKKYLLLQEKQMMAEVFLTSVDAAPSSIKVVSWASAPTKPVWPNTKLLFAVALMAGLSAGVGLAVVLDMFRGRVTADRLSQSSAEITVYATLDGGRKRRTRPVKAAYPNGRSTIMR